MTVQEAKAFFKKHIMGVKTSAQLKTGMQAVIKEHAVIVAPLIAKIHEIAALEGGQQQTMGRNMQQQQGTTQMQQRQNVNSRMAPPPRPNYQNNAQRDTSSLFSIPMPPQNTSSRPNNKVPAMSLEKMMDMMRSSN
ncbi:MAG: hypothetical protein IJ419_01260 [Agathobacter sp.]|nr:hypothetical protein [Agathobacter sp.]